MHSLCYLDFKTIFQSYFDLERCHTCIASSSIYRSTAFIMPKDDSIYILVASGTVLAGRGFGDRCSVHLLFKASVAEKGNWTLDRVCHDYPELSTLNSAFIDTGYLGDKSSDMALSKQA